MARNQRKYNTEYKVQAVKLSNEIGSSKAAVELGIPVDTLYGWVRACQRRAVWSRTAFTASGSPSHALIIAFVRGEVYSWRSLSISSRSFRKAIWICPPCCAA